MASLRTPTVIDGGQGIVKIFKISSCVTGDTVSFVGPVHSWVVVNKTTADAVTATYSSSLFTITVANTPDVDLLVF